MLRIPGNTPIVINNSIFKLHAEKCEKGQKPFTKGIDTDTKLLYIHSN